LFHISTVVGLQSDIARVLVSYISSQAETITVAGAS